MNIEGRGIVLSLGLLEMALVLKKRRRLGDRDAKGPEGRIWDAVAGIGAGFAGVGQGLHAEERR